VKKTAVLACFAGIATAVAGCVPGEKLSFSAGPQQQTMVRDGKGGILSRKKNSIVVLSSASRDLARGARPVFVVGVQNTSKAPRDFRVSEVSVAQEDLGGVTRQLKVVPYEQLVSEERTRQVVGALLVGVVAAGNSAAAHNNSYYRGGGYSPIAGAINSARAEAQNSAMIEGVAASSEINMAALEKNVLKDNTVMPTEWVGGQLHIEAPNEGATGVKRYSITIPVGDDRHEIVVTQGPSS
jgi:hypothetical protein